MQIQNFNTTTYNSNQNWKNETCQYECKNYRLCKKTIVGILVHVLVRTVSI